MEKERPGHQPISGQQLVRVTHDTEVNPQHLEVHRAAGHLVALVGAQGCEVTGALRLAVEVDAPALGLWLLAV